MKKLAIVAVIFAIAYACSGKNSPIVIPGTIIVHAQSLPITKTLGWVAGPVNAVNGAVDNYIVKQDGVVVGTPTGLTQQVTITTTGPHTFTLQASNIWGVSPTVTLNVVVSLPSSPVNFSIN